MKTVQIKLTTNELSLAEQDFGCPSHTRGFADYFRLYWKQHRNCIAENKANQENLIKYLMKCAEILQQANIEPQLRYELIDEMNNIILKATGNKQTQIIF